MTSSDQAIRDAVMAKIEGLARARKFTEAAALAIDAANEFNSSLWFRFLLVPAVVRPGSTVDQVKRDWMARVDREHRALGYVNKRAMRDLARVVEATRGEEPKA